MRRHTAAAATLPLVAQGLLSLGQMTVTLAGTLALAPTAWGKLATILAVFFVAAAFVRGFGNLPLLVYLSGDRQGSRDARRAAMTVSCAVALPASLAPCIAGSALGMPLPGMLLGLALFPFVSYDTARAVEIAGGRWGRVVLADGSLMIALVVGCVIASFGRTDAAAVLASTMLVAYSLGTAALLRSGRAGTPWTVSQYLAAHRREMPFLALDQVLLALATTLTMVVIGVASGIADAGAFRTCLTLFAGPLQVLQAGLSPVIIRRLRRDAILTEGSELDRRARSLRLPFATVIGSLVASAAVGVVATAAATVVLPQLGIGKLDAAAPFITGACVLTSALWGASVITSFMRYRRSNMELMIVRMVVLVVSNAAMFVLIDGVGLATAAAVFVVSGIWAGSAAVHALTRWTKVARV
ncbi:hypothetical protein [Curtobacterium sp. Leaf261]|uniref:hypothetical protein n=1 Tax=Curtobacterium sp. Leaf261 TaxID=1736311 RepID=UPI0006FCAA90|nr:hypothetical protein [Curtobacterium sp. Leaf261]KQO61373.1 hypothetical protein ASF23_12915 [Curtobacterium sp. Leaf261]